jgi:hypothetical protein
MTSAAAAATAKMHNRSPILSWPFSFQNVDFLRPTTELTTDCSLFFLPLQKKKKTSLEAIIISCF